MNKRDKIIKQAAEQIADLDKYEGAAEEHFAKYRTQAMKSPCLYSDCELAAHCGIPVKEFNREHYIAAYHTASSTARWGGLRKSVSTHK